MSYLKRFGTHRVPQSAPLPGSSQVPNSAGGYAWGIDDWARLRRFLILGSEGGSYYASEKNLTRKNAKAVANCVAQDGLRAVAEIVAVSTDGRAPKNDPAILALALAAGRGDEATRKAALEALPRVCRTSTHLFQFAVFVEAFRGWGRSLRRGIARWYAEQPVDALAYQAVKYRQREGVTHRDLLRLSHPATSVSARNPTVEVSAEHGRLFEWIARGGSADGLPHIVEGFVRAQSAASPKESAELVREYRLPREAVRSEHLASQEVWEALLEDMPMTALIRNLATMTRIGVLAPRSTARAKVIEQLGDTERLRKARVHPIALLAALRTYQSGRGASRQAPLEPARRCGRRARRRVLRGVRQRRAERSTDAPRARRLGLDDVGRDRRYPGPDAARRVGGAGARDGGDRGEPEILGFFTGKGGFLKRGRPLRWGSDDGLTPLSISPRQRLDDAVKAVSDLPFGGTDCALPMLYAQAQEREIDTFVIYTDSETWAGKIHPADALRAYRRASGIDASLVVVGMVSNGFSIADPNDGGMLDVVGFDTATPQLISDFARGAL
jgi:60 kDa SS-A/Ro ribonucleoprotein